MDVISLIRRKKRNYQDIRKPFLHINNKNLIDRIGNGEKYKYDK